MFAKILIANRGEIACRVIDTARRLGVTTVAVYSDADADARHVEMADQAVHIGASAASESYLKGDVIIAAALKTGAEAIHPGYGFLSENPDFVHAVEAAGLIFVGPSAEAMRAMGLKDAAKSLMEQAGVAVVPGYHGADQSDKKLAAEAAKTGFPVLIKAVAGGGGKGMRIVRRARDFSDALRAARAEATSAFGNDAVLIEKYIDKPRHIEIQVFGDGLDVVHLFERDCSLQRRHQKVIEEAPAPDMNEELRAAMGAAAVRAAMAIGYEGAGTVEFIVDTSDGLRADRFWFMEMNTRLQVEHPVTEAVTGVDLVEWQLRVAAGESLPKTQDQLHLNGHAFEARLYAEDVAGGFLPATGTLTHLRFPQAARIETGVRQGDEISPHYDPLIAKIVVHGATREIALLQLKSAISQLEVIGTVTNRTFLGPLAGQPDFTAGQVDTGLIEREIATLSAEPDPSGPMKALAAIVACGLEAGVRALRGYTLWTPLKRNIVLNRNGVEFEVSLQICGPGEILAGLDGGEYKFVHTPGGWQSDGGAFRARTLKLGDSVHVFSACPPYPTYRFVIIDPLAARSVPGSGGNEVLAPMPGVVKAVFARR
ncbi:MAG: acetyl/propionyl/methylcrotonyl-CoA carboxylase subunit alpha, partial [Paracoccaceae bacterium]